jgi:hypothetical protein
MSHEKALSCLLAAASLAGCAYYDGPPDPTLAEASEGLLADATKPILVTFSEPFDPATLHVKLAPFITDAEGNLGDEDEDPATELVPTFKHDPDLIDEGGFSEIIDEKTLRITPAITPFVGAQLVLLFEPGLADKSGNATTVRKRLVFGYEFKCAGGVGTQIFQSGTYFFLVQVEKPIATQIQFFGSIVVDSESGLFVGQFTNADRDRTQTCPDPCKSTEACKLIPEPKCVVPSERATTVDEYPDYVPNDVLPAGYSFTVAGCVEDQPNNTAAFSNSPADVVVLQPPVTVKSISLGSAFAVDAEGVLRGAGSMKSVDVLLGTSSSGPGQGSLTARIIPEAEVPPGVPPPPAP